MAWHAPRPSAHSVLVSYWSSGHNSKRSLAELDKWMTTVCNLIIGFTFLWIEQKICNKYGANFAEYKIAFLIKKTYEV